MSESLTDEELLAARNRFGVAHREDSIAGLGMHYEWMRDIGAQLLDEVERLRVDLKCEQIRG